VEAKFVKEEQKSFHLHFPRFLVYFIPGLHLNPLQWEANKGKGHIYVDGTNGLPGTNMAGSCNTHIPKPSLGNPDECPPVYYSMVLKRYYIMIWPLHITYPDIDILLHADRHWLSPPYHIALVAITGGCLVFPPQASRASPPLPCLGLVQLLSYLPAGHLRVPSRLICHLQSAPPSPRQRPVPHGHNHCPPGPLRKDASNIQSCSSLPRRHLPIGNLLGRWTSHLS
jgi:hypothetical protein